MQRPLWPAGEMYFLFDYFCFYIGFARCFLRFNIVCSIREPAREVVCAAQLPALVLMVIKECWDVKNDTRNPLGRRSGQMVVRSGLYNLLRFLKRNLFVLSKTVSYYQEHHVK